MLSVIVPVYNVQNYLEDCLNSIINQTYINLEIVLVNDGSTDNSGNICERYASLDRRIHVVHQANQGRSCARNTGLSYVSSQYVTFVDADDTLNMNVYKTAMETFGEHNIDLVCFGIEVVGDASISTRSCDNDYYKIRYDGLKQLNTEIISNMDVSVCNKIFKKEVIEQYDIRFPDGVLFEDAAFFYKYVVLANYVFFLPEKYYFYLRHDNSIMVDTFRKTTKSIDHLYMFKDIYSFFVKNHLTAKWDMLIRDLFVRYLYLAYKYTPKNQEQEVLQFGKMLKNDILQYKSQNFLFTKIKIKKFFGDNKLLNNTLFRWLFSTKLVQLIWHH